MGVAGIVAAMGINLSKGTIPLAQPADRLQAGFILILGGLLAVLKRVVLPHIGLAAGIWLVTVYAVYKTATANTYLPGFLIGLYGLLFVLISAVGAFVYAFLMALFCALKEAATYAEDFFYELFEILKTKIRAHIANMEEGIAKQQAKVIVDNSIREVLAPLKKFKVGSVANVVSGVLLAVLTFVSRAVFLARLARLTGATVNLSAIFASRATLVGALFLNMRWLATFILWLLYGIGCLMLAWDIWVIV